MSDFTDLETELKRLQPRPVSPELSGRIEAALAQEVTATPTAGVLPRPAKPRVNWFTFALGTAAAAALVVFALVNAEHAPRSQQTVAASTPAAVAGNTPADVARAQSSGSFVPDGLTRVVYHRRDEGLVYSRTTESPARRVRSRARETLQWREPGTGASLRVSYPTEEVELIPVSAQ